MLIHVMFPDNRHDFVKPGMLDPLIESCTITKFKRSSGWVTIGIDPVRTKRRNTHSLTQSDMKKLSSLIN